MKTSCSSLILTLFLSFAFKGNANFIYHWLPTTGTSLGFIEISDAAYAAGTFNIADIITFQFVEPAFLPNPSIWSQTTWDIVNSASGTLTANKQAIQTLSLTGNYSTPPSIDLFPRNLAPGSVHLNTSIVNVLGIVATSHAAGLQNFSGSWGNVTQTSASVPETGSTAGLLSLSLVGMALIAGKRRNKFDGGAARFSLRA